MKDSKRKYDSVLAGLEAGRGNLEREVNQIRKQHTKERAEFHIQRATLENLHSLQDRLQDAGKKLLFLMYPALFLRFICYFMMYDNHYLDTWREVLNRKLRESEMRSKDLRDQQRALREQKVLSIRFLNGIYI